MGRKVTIDIDEFLSTHYQANGTYDKAYWENHFRSLAGMKDCTVTDLDITVVKAFNEQHPPTPDKFEVGQVWRHGNKNMEFEILAVRKGYAWGKCVQEHYQGNDCDSVIIFWSMKDGTFVR